MGDFLTDESLTQWSYGTKLFNCSNEKEHEESCDGNCGQHPATKGQVDLHNEVAIWTSNNKPVVGLPAVIASQIPVSGFPVEILSTDRRLTALLELLVEKEIFTEEEFLETYRLSFAAFLKEAREQVERHEAKASIIIPQIGLAKPPPEGNGHA